MLRRSPGDNVDFRFGQAEHLPGNRVSGRVIQEAARRMTLFHQLKAGNAATLEKGAHFLQPEAERQRPWIHGGVECDVGLGIAVFRAGLEIAVRTGALVGERGNLKSLRIVSKSGGACDFNFPFAPHRRDAVLIGKELRQLADEWLCQFSRTKHRFQILQYITCRWNDAELPPLWSLQDDFAGPA